MFRTSTYFIKEQIPGTTIRQLLLLYGIELENQGVNDISIDRDAIAFSRAEATWEFNTYYNRYSSFAKGEIRITDEGTEYIVDFRADTSSIATMPAIFASTVSLILFVMSGFDWGPLLGGCVLFVVAVILSFINLRVTFPVYFVSLRNDIENQLFDGK